MRAITIAEVLAALRSGDYRQTKGKLRTKKVPKFCCLGVAEDVSGTEWYADEFYGCARDDDWSADITQIATANRMGEWGRFILEAVLDDDPLGSDIRHHLATLNDDGKTFAEIADYIEAEAAARGYPV